MNKVTKKQAEGLKALGFDKPCEWFYDESYLIMSIFGDAINSNKYPNLCSAPDIYTAICFMDELGVHVEVFFEYDRTWYLFIVLDNGEYLTEEAITGFSSRTDAFSAGLDFAIEYLIQQKKENK